MRLPYSRHRRSPLVRYDPVVSDDRPPTGQRRPRRFLTEQAPDFVLYPFCPRFCVGTLFPVADIQRGQSSETGCHLRAVIQSLRYAEVTHWFSSPLLPNAASLQPSMIAKAIKMHGCGNMRRVNLAHDCAHSSMIRLQLVTQIRGRQPPDQAEYARRPRKPHLLVQVGSYVPSK